MTNLNKSLTAALISAAMGLAAPAVAQSSVTINDPDARGLTIVTKAPEGPVVVARDDGSQVVTQRIVRKQWVIPTLCNFNTIRNKSGLRNVSGGIGGSIGGRMILGSSAADDVPLPGTCAPIPR
jgi:hypothetical protein